MISSVVKLAIEDVRLITPKVFADERGRFFETWHAELYAACGAPKDFAQDSISVSAGGVIRGMHFQHPQSQGKLVSVLRGRVFDVAVDVRRDSPTFGQWVGQELSADNHHQLWIPRGFAHGFAVLSDDAMVSYKCSAYYAPEYEHTIRWNDPALGIDWPLTSPIVAPKDANAPFLAEMPLAQLPSVRDYPS